jgi:hypothetical protein
LCGADAQDDGGAASENVLFSDHCFSPLGSINDVFGALLRFTRNGVVHRMFHLSAHENGPS